MSSLPPCPQCKSEFTYEDGDNFVCPECAHEWPRVAAAEEQKVVEDDVDEDALAYIKAKRRVVELQKARKQKY